MSVDKLRRALLAQKQRIDGAQQQQSSNQTGTSLPTETVPQPAVKQTKRKAQEAAEETSNYQSRHASSSSSKPSSTKSSRPNPTPTPASNHKHSPAAAAAPATHKKHKSNHNATTTVTSTAPPPHQLSSNLSALSTKLASSRFRWLNEQLYTLPSTESFAHFSAHPADYEAYHTGFRQQVQRWPSHPLDLIIAHLQSLTTPHTIVDMGCGDARIAATLLASSSATPRHTIHSFDLVPHSHHVTPCNIAATPLPPHTADTLVYCLSLMPTDYRAVLSEGMRILKPGGELIVAEVSSRLVAGGGVEGFVRGLEAMGVRRRKVVDNDYFALVWCTKEQGKNKQTASSSAGAKKKSKSSASADGRSGVQEITRVVLTPCIYKKR